MKHPSFFTGSLAAIAVLSLAAGAVAALAGFAKPPKQKPMTRYPKKVRVEGRRDGDAVVTTAYYVYSTDDEKQPGGEIQ